jgi:hypothetical protein
MAGFETIKEGSPTSAQNGTIKKVGDQVFKATYTDPNAPSGVWKALSTVERAEWEATQAAAKKAADAKTAGTGAPPKTKEQLEKEEAARLKKEAAAKEKAEAAAAAQKHIDEGDALAGELAGELGGGLNAVVNSPAGKTAGNVISSMIKPSQGPNAQAEGHARLADLSEETAAKAQKAAQQHAQKGNRDIISTGDAMAAAADAAQNANKVANRGAAAGAGAAALDREVTKPEYVEQQKIANEEAIHAEESTAVEQANKGGAIENEALAGSVQELQQDVAQRNKDTQAASEPAPEAPAPEAPATPEKEEEPEAPGDVKGDEEPDTPDTPDTPEAPVAPPERGKPFDIKASKEELETTDAGKQVLALLEGKENVPLSNDEVAEINKLLPAVGDTLIRPGTADEPRYLRQFGTETHYDAQKSHTKSETGGWEPDEKEQANIEELNHSGHVGSSGTGWASDKRIKDIQRIISDIRAKRNKQQTRKLVAIVGRRF